jgi:antitoxin component of MazEF toxin-antitoxin module
MTVYNEDIVTKTLIFLPHQTAPADSVMDMLIRQASRHWLQLGCCLLMLAAFTTAAFAEQVTTQIDCYAGLAPVVQLECDDVSFGSWRVPRGQRAGGATTLELKIPALPPGFLRLPQIILNFLQAILPEASTIANIIEPQYSECRLTGSSLNEGTEVTLTLTNNQDIVLKPVAVLGLAAVKTVAAQMKANLRTNQSTATIDENGAAVWKIIGDFTIPDGLDVDHYGGLSSLSGTTATYSHDD